MSAVNVQHQSLEFQAMLQYLDGIKHMDIDKLLPIITDDFTHHFQPRSLGIRSINGKAAFRKYIESMAYLLPHVEVTIHEHIEAPGKLFMHATSKSTSRTGLPYANECCLIMHFIALDGGPLKISLIREFVDSKFNAHFFEEEREKRKALRGERKVDVEARL
ncbi:hypothetical protein JB92DRAFT_3115516 [Gautieria morchelliformis]|nr:hypothetical protein JB92DRAFT_3115516 [Gautieria morchelliformis]